MAEFRVRCHEAPLLDISTDVAFLVADDCGEGIVGSLTGSSASSRAVLSVALSLSLQRLVIYSEACRQALAKIYPPSGAHLRIALLKNLEFRYRRSLV